MKKKKQNPLVNGILAGVMGLTLFSPFYSSTVKAEEQEKEPKYTVTYKTIDEIAYLDEPKITKITTKGSVLTIDWEEVTDAESYDVSVNGGKATNVTDNTVTIEDVELNKDAEYTVTVTAKASGKISASKAATFTYTKEGNQSFVPSEDSSDEDSLEEPEITKVETKTAEEKTSITVTWEEITDAKSYEVSLGDETPITVTKPTATLETEALEADTEYSITVTAIAEGKESSSRTATFTYAEDGEQEITLSEKETKTTVLEQPQITKITSTTEEGTTSLTIAWGSVTDAESYDVSFDGAEAVNVRKNTVMMDEVTLEEGEEYTVTITAKAEGKASAAIAATFTFTEDGKQTFSQVGDSDYDSSIWTDTTSLSVIDKVSWTSKTEQSVAPTGISYPEKEGKYLDGWYYFNSTDKKLEKAETLQTIGATEGGSVTLYGRYIDAGEETQSVTIQVKDYDDTDVAIEGVEIAIFKWGDSVQSTEDTEDSKGDVVKATVIAKATSDEEGKVTFDLPQGHYEAVQTDITNATSSKKEDGTSYVSANVYRYLINVGEEVSYAKLNDYYSSEEEKSAPVDEVQFLDRLATAHKVTYHLDGGKMTVSNSQGTSSTTINGKDYASGYTVNVLDGDGAASYFAWKETEGTHVYAFKGWYTDETYTTEFDFCQGITKDTDVYAYFVEAPTVTVTVNFTDDGYVTTGSSGSNKQDLSSYSLSIPVVQNISRITTTTTLNDQGEEEITSTSTEESNKQSVSGYYVNDEAKETKYSISDVLQTLSKLGYEFSAFSYGNGESNTEKSEIPTLIEYTQEQNPTDGEKVSAALKYYYTDASGEDAKAAVGLSSDVDDDVVKVINVHVKHLTYNETTVSDASTTEYIRTINFVDSEDNPLNVVEDAEGNKTSSITQTAVITKGKTVSEVKDAVTKTRVKTASTNYYTSVTIPWDTVYAPTYSANGVTYKASPSVVRGAATVSAITDGVDTNNEEIVTVKYYSAADKIPVTVSITGNKVTAEYDGESHTASGYTVEGDVDGFNADDVVFTGTAEVSGTDAGVYGMGLRVEQFSLSDSAKNKYIVTFTVKDGSLTIDPKPIKVQANEASKVEGETDPTFTATITDAEGNEITDALPISYTISRNAGEKAGIYKIHPTGTYIQGNYAVTYGYNVFTITKKEVTPTTTPTPSNMPTDVPNAGSQEDSELAFASHADLFDEEQTISFVGIGTKLADVTESTEESEEGYYYLTDTVSYYKLTVGKEYTLTGTLMDKSTEEALSGAESSTITFIPEKEDGTVEVTFKIPKSNLAGKTVVAYEDLLLDDVTIAVHHDINDADQTVTYPGEATFSTSASGTNGKTLAPSTSMTVNDTISYTNLTAGDKYEVTGSIHTNSSGTDAGITKDAKGNDITKTETFTVDESGSGTWTMTFTFDGRYMTDGTKLVVFENAIKLDSDGNKATETLTHEDITDENQTVEITVSSLDKTMKTTATSDGSKSVPAADSIVITDVVSYTGLETTVTYTLKGEIHLVNEDGTDGGKLVETTQDFIPSATSGTVTMTFPAFDGAQLAGRKTVVFESLCDDLGVELISHKDLNDTDQTVSIETPTIKTTATDASDNDKYVSSAESVTIKDVVTYSSLVPNKEYTLKGDLHLIGTDGSDEKVLVSAEKTFTPTASNGTVEMEFTFDSSELSGRKTVVFEELEQNGKSIAVHNDIQDEGQTVTIETPGEKTMHTTATSNGSKTVEASSSIVITDVVSYTGLDTSKKYSLKGEVHLVNEDGSDGGKLVEATQEFTPAKANGSVTMTFTAFDGSQLAGKKTVVFEYLYEDGKQVVTHTDLTDEGQTVTITTPPTTPPTSTPTPTPTPTATPTATPTSTPTSTPETITPGISTLAYNGSDGTDGLDPKANQKVVDEVEYWNLEGDTVYEMRGTVHLKNTDGSDGGVLYDADGKAVTATTKFKTGGSKGAYVSGTVNMTFTFNATGLNKRDVVVFEQCWNVDTGVQWIVASHEDITAENQTMYIDSTRVRRRRRWWWNTGSGSDMIVYGGIGLSAVVAIGAIIYVESKKKKATKA